MIAILIGGVGIGFVLSCVMFMSKMWRLEDEMDYYKSRARFYKRECVKQHRENIEWENASQCASRDLFTNF